MRPAFTTTRSALAFALLLTGLMTLPAFVAHTGWLKRNEVYPAIPWKCGPFIWAQQKIFSETNDVDIAFVGSSLIWGDINPTYVQKELSLRLGHEAEVFTLGWPWPGFDAVYIVARDLLEHRRVRMLVIYDEAHGNTTSPDVPHIQSARWFRIGENDEALSGLTWSAKLSLYGSALLGMPRSLLSLLRPNLTESAASHRTNVWDTPYHAESFAAQLGGMRAHLAFNNSPNFKPFHPTPIATPADAVIYSDATRDLFRFTGPVTPPFRSHFLHKLAALCETHGTQLVIFHPPGFGERTREKILEREVWPDVLGTNVWLVGIPGAKLFAGISAEDMKKLYYNKGHLNANGQDFFTPLITPALLEIYAAKNK